MLKMTLYGNNILSSVYLASKADAITSRWLCPLSDISKLSPLPCNNHHGDGDWKSTSSTESATQNLASARSLYWTRLSVVTIMVATELSSTANSGWRKSCSHYIEIFQILGDVFYKKIIIIKFVSKIKSKWILIKNDF